MAGTVAGVVVGVFAGPPGLVAGGLVGGAIGILIGSTLENVDARQAAHDRELDKTIGVIGGDIGALTEGRS
jgi:uncharacterized protein YqgC (DUF456 family)